MNKVQRYLTMRRNHIFVSKIHDIGYLFISFFQNKEFMQTDVLKTINTRLDVFEKSGYYPGSDTLINTYMTQGRHRLNVIYFRDKIVIKGYYGELKVISIKYDRNKNKITTLLMGKLKNNEEAVEQLLNKIKRIAQLPDKNV